MQPQPHLLEVKHRWSHNNAWKACKYPQNSTDCLLEIRIRRRAEAPAAYGSARCNCGGQFIVLDSVFTLCTWTQQRSLSAGARRPNEEGCSYVHAFHLRTINLVQQRVPPAADSCVAATCCVSVVTGDLVNRARLYNRAGKVSRKGTVRKYHPSNCTRLFGELWLAGVSLTPPQSGRGRHKLRLLKVGSAAGMLPPPQGNHRPSQAQNTQLLLCFSPQCSCAPPAHL